MLDLRTDAIRLHGLFKQSLCPLIAQLACLHKQAMTHTIQQIRELRNRLDLRNLRQFLNTLVKQLPNLLRQRQSDGRVVSAKLAHLGFLNIPVVIDGGQDVERKATVSHTRKSSIVESV